DKTGTVTTGRMSVVDVVPAGGVDRAEVLRIAGALEHASEHPIARAIAACATAETGELPAVESFSSRAGLGVTGVVDGVEAAVGRAGLVAAGSGGVPDDELVAAADAAEAAGRTPVLVAWDGGVRGV